MNAPRIRRRSLMRFPLAIVLLLISLVPNSIGTAQYNPDVQTLPGGDSAVNCGRPGCCVSECYSGTWYSTWSMCLQGGNGSCMYCDTRCCSTTFC